MDDLLVRERLEQLTGSERLNYGELKETFPAVEPDTMVITVPMWLGMLRRVDELEHKVSELRRKESQTNGCERDATERDG